jgi:hypothetical protein
LSSLGDTRIVIYGGLAGKTIKKEEGVVGDDLYLPYLVTRPLIN